MASIDVQKEDYQSALERLSESYQILLEVGRLDGICVLAWIWGNCFALRACGKKGWKS